MLHSQCAAPEGQLQTMDHGDTTLRVLHSNSAPLAHVVGSVTMEDPRSPYASLGWTLETSMKRTCDKEGPAAACHSPTSSLISMDSIFRLEL
jgi:hypothetical protein